MPKDFEEELRKLINDYGAPEHIKQELEEFLINSGNVYTIIELSKECE